MKHTNEQLQFLALCGCDQTQGFFMVPRKLSVGGCLGGGNDDLDGLGQ